MSKFQDVNFQLWKFQKVLLTKNREKLIVFHSVKEQTEKLDQSFDSDDEDEQEATDCLDFLNGEGDSDDNSDEERVLSFGLG